jgi:hypothetical protein
MRDLSKLAEELETALKVTLSSLVVAADKFQTGEDDTSDKGHSY